MKRHIRPLGYVLGLIILLAVPAVTLAADAVAFVNISRVMEQCPQTEALFKQLEQEFSPREAELVAERDALREMQQRLERDAEIMGSDERSELQREFRNRSREFQHNQEMFQEDLNSRRNEELARVQRLVQSVILDIAQRDELDLVVTERTVVYASDRADITGRVLEELRRRYESSGE
ncbi:periplasmic chaperone for outer membrane proteins Skp [Ectothiorhodospira mobilis]|uniref:Periplasmic chaperone for outer membrane proteins Skp n=1 Tax=Ectothiorhodospira mobilis TaxID=195064 RepID=A0A1I4RR44_ECTMO|nr:OmpH family outer membrane protein [Ectothiorhodospira mobilis]SFM54656.1 periplasmic chaperone for outer membrane proteins Skp [Ectothiorhodospira mobilis]